MLLILLIFFLVLVFFFTALKGIRAFIRSLGENVIQIAHGEGNA